MNRIIPPNGVEQIISMTLILFFSTGPSKASLVRDLIDRTTVVRWPESMSWRWSRGQTLDPRDVNAKFWTLRQRTFEEKRTCR